MLTVGREETDGHRCCQTVSVLFVDALIYAVSVLVERREGEREKRERGRERERKGVRGERRERERQTV